MGPPLSQEVPGPYLVLWELTDPPLRKGNESHLVVEVAEHLLPCWGGGEKELEEKEPPRFLLQ